jgi:uncharacterized protein (TIGR02145 family)
MSNSPSDWRNPQNNNFWQGVVGINNPCPPGFRIPTDIEWDNERLSWSVNNYNRAYNSPLKLSVAGSRHYHFGVLSLVGSSGSYWSNTIVGTNSFNLDFISSNANMSSKKRSYGFTVRCLKD